MPLDPRKPVCHVSWYEADAFARYGGKRLPTEAEWGRLASWDPGGRRKAIPVGDERRAPDHANLDQLAFGTAPAGAYPDGASAYGAEQMVGDVWEWTASGFEAYDGFEAFPYPEYSEPFFRWPVQGAEGRLVGNTTGRRHLHLPELGLPRAATDLRRVPLRTRR